MKFSRTCINFSTIFLFHHNYFTCFLVVKVFFFWIQNGGIFSVSWMAAFFSESKMAATRRLQKELGDIRKAGGKNFRDIQVKDYHKLKKRKNVIFTTKNGSFLHNTSSPLYIWLNISSEKSYGSWDLIMYTALYCIIYFYLSVRN